MITTLSTPSVVSIYKWVRRRRRRLRRNEGGYWIKKESCTSIIDEHSRTNTFARSKLWKSRNELPSKNYLHDSSGEQERRRNVKGKKKNTIKK
jgi:hypothetical protein